VTTVRISLFDTEAQLRELRPDLERRLVEVVGSGRFILGPELATFERSFADYLGVEHVIGVGNGTDALTIALIALGIGPGDDVVVPSFTFYASAEAIPHSGARPVFCDIDPETFCVTAETVERALTARTRAIVIVHLFGTPAPVAELRALAAERGIALIEDAAQAAGATVNGDRVGSLGDVATFSFFPSKNLFCIGDGGAIATNDSAVAEQARLLRSHGSRDKLTYATIGFNSRLDELQAAVLSVNLERLDEQNARRRALAGAYAEAGLGDYVGLPVVPDGAEPVYHLFVTRADDRAKLAAALDRAGIDTRSYYEVPVHLQPPMAPYAPEAPLPGTDRASATNLALPMGPTHSPETAQAVVSALAEA
jgi:dTDP-3-amino-3,4,6-trideoxy-alpha-D-glucose transaminase